jgi:hypothetical protein
MIFWQKRSLEMESLFSPKKSDLALAISPSFLLAIIFILFYLNLRILHDINVDSHFSKEMQMQPNRRNDSQWILHVSQTIEKPSKVPTPEHSRPGFAASPS